MKTYQSSIKPNTQQRGEKGTRWKDASHGKGKIFQKGWTIKGMGIDQVFEPPFIVKNISYNESKRTYKRMFSLEEPSLIIIACFKIEATYACCNPTNTFYL
jgi:hypothetical protein